MRVASIRALACVTRKGGGFIVRLYVSPDEAETLGTRSSLRRARCAWRTR
jgi:hypothetical protein